MIEMPLTNETVIDVVGAWVELIWSSMVMNEHRFGKEMTLIFSKIGNFHPSRRALKVCPNDSLDHSE
jgi:hypothetical protein